METNINRLNVSFIIPARNELEGLKTFLPQLKQAYPHCELIVVNDGSTDDTARFAQSCGAKVISHPYPLGNGASIKTGARNAQGDVLVFMDGDGQHNLGDVERLLKTYAKGYDMVVGARSREGQASLVRLWGNRLYNFIATQVVGQHVQDLTSGFRVVNARKFKEFIHLLPNGFSYPSTITLAFFRTGYTLCYVPIEVSKRLGKSHLKPFSDGIRFLIIIYKITTLYSPLKVFIPLGILHLVLGLANYTYTYLHDGRFTNMSAVLISTAIIIFLIGVVSEQITTLIYQSNQNE